MKQKELFVALKKKSEISEVFDSGLKLYSRNLLIRYTQNDERNSLPFFILVAISKKQNGAVRRNRFKRICRSALFQAMKNIPSQIYSDMKSSFNVVIHARENLENLSEPERINEFEEIIRRLVKSA